MLVKGRAEQPTRHYGRYGGPPALLTEGLRQAGRFTEEVGQAGCSIHGDVGVGR